MTLVPIEHSAALSETIRAPHKVQDLCWRHLMKLKELAGYVLFLGLAVTLTSSVSARAGEGKDKDKEDCKESDHHDHNAKTPVGLVGVIPVPGNPIISADIAWVDPGTERYYFADRSNFGVDIIDAESNVWVGRVTGMAGPNPR